MHITCSFGSDGLSIILVRNNERGDCSLGLSRPFNKKTCFLVSKLDCGYGLRTHIQGPKNWGKLSNPFLSPGLDLRRVRFQTGSVEFRRGIRLGDGLVPVYSSWWHVDRSTAGTVWFDLNTFKSIFHGKRDGLHPSESNFSKRHDSHTYYR